MITRNFIGEGGPDSCVRFNCMADAVVEFLTEVKHPGQEPRRIRSRFCAEHEKVQRSPERRRWYPNFTVIEEKRL